MSRRLGPLRVLMVSAAAAATLWGSPARADPTADGKDLFARGRQLRMGGDCAGAVPLFSKAYELYPAGLGSLRNVAECDESLGRFASARRAWLDLERALVKSQEPKYAGWTEDAKDAAGRLAPKVATLVIALDVVPPDDGAAVGAVEVTLNGEILGPGLTGTPLERDPGRYVIRVAGKRVSAPREVTIELSAGEARRVPLEVVLSSETAPTSPATPVAVSRRSAAWVALGIGAAGLIGAGVSFAIYQSALDELKNACGPLYSVENDNVHQCAASPQTFQPIEDRGHTAGAFATALVVVGAVGLAGGAVLLATTPSSSTRAAVLLSPTGVSALGRF